MFRGFATVTYFAADLTAASYWHRRAFDTDPYFASAPASVYEPSTGRCDSDFPTASVVDPFGIMHDPHYLDMPQQRTKPQ